MRLKELMSARIETARLVLRHPRNDDLDDLVAQANNWAVLEPTASLPFPYLPEHGRGFIERVANKPDKLSLVIAGRDDDRLKGVIGLYFHDDRPTELGYWLGQEHWGRGYAPEAVAGLLEEASRGGISPIRARVLAANPASVRVLEKCGFTQIEQTTSVVERHRGKPLLILEWRL